MGNVSSHSVTVEHSLGSYTSTPGLETLLQCIGYRLEHGQQSRQSLCLTVRILLLFMEILVYYVVCTQDLNTGKAVITITPIYGGYPSIRVRYKCVTPTLYVCGISLWNFIYRTWHEFTIGDTSF